MPTTAKLYLGSTQIGEAGIAGAVISDTPTSSYSSGGVTYDYWEFNSSGSINVTQDGLADILLVGGGGGSGSGYGGGGGGGGVLETSQSYLSAGSVTVTVGAGGAGVASTGVSAGRNGANGFPSRVGDIYSPGGGGGGGYTRESTVSGTQIKGDLGGNGASGGGGSGYLGGSAPAGGTGVSGLGNDGGAGGNSSQSGGSGGGAGAAGTSGSNQTGGAGKSSSYSGSAVTYGGGGGGGTSGTGAAVERREPAALVAAGTLALMGLPTRAVAAVVSEPSRKTAGQVAAARLSFV